MIQIDVIESICDEIADLDSKIRFVGIIDNKGRLLAQNKNNELDVILSMQERDILLAEIAFGIRMERDYDEYFGTENFAISYGSKMISIVLPLHNEIVCVFTLKDIDVTKIAFSISSVLSKTRHN